MKDGIIEVRQKDTLLPLIRELLATVGVAVTTNTIARFLAEANHNRNGSLSDHFARVAPQRERPTRNLLAVPAATAEGAEKPSDRSRVRSPRIIDLGGVLRSHIGARRTAGYLSESL